MDRPEALFVGPVPVGYVCPDCGALVPIVDRRTLRDPATPDPWDVHAQWHATLREA